MSDQKKMVRIADLLPKPVEVEVSPGNFLEVNALPLSSIVKLLWAYREAFLSVYVDGVNGTPKYDQILMSCPDMVADIIALGCDADGQQDDIKKLPGTVQLIALKEIWGLSVPDAKKFKEALSGFMAEMGKAAKAQQNAAVASAQSTDSNETSATP